MTDERARREKLLSELFGDLAKKKTVSIFKKKKRNTDDSASSRKRKRSRDDSSPVAGGSMDIDEREAAIASLKRKKDSATKEVHIFYLYLVLFSSV
jgi:chromatin segregation and condensation protein Rec8/ScpA/Scc1 (kleisin family)